AQRTTAPPEKDPMTPFHLPLRTCRAILLPLLATAVLVACGGGGLDPVLGTPVAGIAPTVSATTPAAGPPMATGVATNSRVFATFSKPMAAATISANSFTLACPAGTAVPATVSYNAATQVATLTPNAA